MTNVCHLGRWAQFSAFGWRERRIIIAETSVKVSTKLGDVYVVTQAASFYAEDGNEVKAVRTSLEKAREYLTVRGFHLDHDFGDGIEAWKGNTCYAEITVMELK